MVLFEVSHEEEQMRSPLRPRSWHPGARARLFPTAHLVQPSLKSSDVLGSYQNYFCQCSNSGEIKSHRFSLSLCTNAVLGLVPRDQRSRSAAVGARVVLRELSPREKAASVTCQRSPHSEPLIRLHFHMRHENVLLCLTAAPARPGFHPDTACF